jgi:hypothetical protein
MKGISSAQERRQPLQVPRYQEYKARRLGIPRIRRWDEGSVCVKAADPDNPGAKNFFLLQMRMSCNHK